MNKGKTCAQQICNVCPRACGVNRAKKKGFCHQNNKIHISKVMLHHFEEPVISARAGSGAVFFTGCNLSCVFCQNHKISQQKRGRSIGIKGLVKIFKKLVKKGAANINLVTPTHFSLQIIDALKIYKPPIPVVWNSSGYESVETIKMMEGLVDVFLVDYKYADNRLAKKYSAAPNYAETAQAAIREMKRQQPKDIVVDGVLTKGVIIRHLVLPTHTDDSINCLKFVASLDNKSIVSIMSQYNPVHNAHLYPEINRTLTPLEYKRVVSYALKLGMTNCYTQDLSSANTCDTPRF